MNFGFHAGFGDATLRRFEFLGELISPGSLDRGREELFAGVPFLPKPGRLPRVLTPRRGFQRIVLSLNDDVGRAHVRRRWAAPGCAVRNMRHFRCRDRKYLVVGALSHSTSTYTARASNFKSFHTFSLQKFDTSYDPS